MALEAVKEHELEAVDAAESTGGQDGGKGKSTIVFAYLPLEEACTIAKGVNAVGGTSCQIDQLAAHLKQRPNTGAFRLKLLTAKHFGLITYSMGSVSLTPLGSRICDSQQEQIAKAESFLTIPLYLKLYDQFKGASLPPLAGLEAAIVSLGVTPKQKDTARQVFQRSAHYAGFFWSGSDRLVYPKIKGSASAAIAADISRTVVDPEDHPEKLDRKRGGNGTGGGDGSDHHPFIAGLLKTLPAADSEWPMDARRKWLQAASTIFEVIYKDSESKGSLRIEIQRDAK